MWSGFDCPVAPRRTGKRVPSGDWQFRTGKRGGDWQFRTGKRGGDWQFRTGKRGGDWQFREHRWDI